MVAEKILIQRDELLGAAATGEPPGVGEGGQFDGFQQRGAVALEHHSQLSGGGQRPHPERARHEVRAQHVLQRIELRLVGM